MTRQLTLEEAVKLHRELWNKMADTVEFNKDGIRFSSLFYEKRRIIYDMGYNDLENHCFLCEYVKQQESCEEIFDGSRECRNYCPLYNPSSTNSRCLNGLYYTVEDLFFDFVFYNKSKEELVKTIRAIAELPVIERKGKKK